MLSRWVLVAALAALAHAGTTNRRPAAPVTVQQAGITSLSDQGNKRKAMEHAAFANAGRAAGLEVWRIENFEPVPVPASDFGKFYKGDSYVVLKTTADRRGKLSWDIHYWLGVGTSQDEAGAAAILTVGLDDKFNGAAVQHREVQGHESQQFVGYFSPAIRYLDGGHASGFSHVTTNAGAEKRLFQVKGKRNVRVRQIDPLIASMNKGDCFILDVNHEIYVYVGENAKRVERLKAISVANQIRDQDHNGRARVEIIDEFSSQTDTQKFFAELGSGSRDVVPEESAGGDDQTFERGEETAVTLYEISDATGTLKATPLARPYRQEQLKPQECYILDTVSGTIYVWVGRQSNDKEKAEAMSKAQQYLTSKSYPSWVHVSRIPQGTEPAAFKQYFTTWRDVGMSHSRIVRSLSDEELFDSDDETSGRRARIIGKTGSARGFMPDNGEGNLTIYRIENRELKKVYDQSGPAEGHVFGQLYQGDSYVLQYEYRTADGARGHVIYYWLGKDSTLDEQAAAALHTVTLDNQLSGAALQVRVPQGEEPKHLLKLFKGRLITLLGGKGSGFRNANQRDSYDTDGTRLFRVYGTEAGVDIRAEQAEERASSLLSDDVFILETPQQVYVWHGQSSSAAERSEAAEFVRLLLGGRAYETVEQGAEPDAFWTALGGRGAAREGAWRDRLAARAGTEARLFEASVANNNVVTFEEFHDYKQEDLSQEAVFVLDTADEVYIWIGQEAPQHEKKAATTIFEQYVRRYGERRSVLIVVKQGLEPQLFKNIFGDWDEDMWRKQKSYDSAKEEALLTNEI